MSSFIFRFLQIFFRSRETPPYRVGFHRGRCLLYPGLSADRPAPSPRRFPVVLRRSVCLFLPVAAFLYYNTAMPRAAGEEPPCPAICRALLCGLQFFILPSLRLCPSETVTSGRRNWDVSFIYNERTQGFRPASRTLSLKGDYSIPLSLTAIADFLCAALFLCSKPLPAARSTVLTATL